MPAAWVVSARLSLGGPARGAAAGHVLARAQLAAVVHRSPTARAGDLWRSMARPSPAGEVATPLPNGTVRHRDAKSGTALHKAVGRWNGRSGHRSPTAGWRSIGDRWCCGPWAAGLLSTWLPLEQSVAAGDQANSIGPLGSPAPLFRRGLCTVAQDRAARCTGAKGQVPSARWHLRARCQVNLALMHETALSGTGRKVMHHPAQADPSSEWPHLSKAARQATWAAFPTDLSGSGCTWPRLTQPEKNEARRLSAPDRSKAGNSQYQRAAGGRGLTDRWLSCRRRRLGARDSHERR
jgi:hypothetical protein